MTIDYSAFGDELEKIAKNRLQQMYEAGKISLDDVLSAVGKRRYNPQVGVRSTGAGMQDRLTRIKKTRYLKKGMSEQEADRAARAGAAAALHGDTVSGSLRQELKRSAASKRGLSDKALRKAEIAATKEQGVLTGRNQPHVMVAGWGDDTHAGMKSLSTKQKAQLKERAAQLGMKRELGGTRTSGSSLFRGKLETDIATHDKARLMTERAKEQAAERVKQRAGERAVQRATGRLRRKAVQQARQDAGGRVEQLVAERAKQQAVERAKQQAARAPAPAPTAPAPAPAPTSAPTQTQEGLSSAAKAALGLTAAGGLGAGVYGVHRLRQRQ